MNYCCLLALQRQYLEGETEPRKKRKMTKKAVTMTAAPAVKPEEKVTGTSIPGIPKVEE